MIVFFLKADGNSSTNSNSDDRAGRSVGGRVLERVSGGAKLTPTVTHERNGKLEPVGRTGDR